MEFEVYRQAWARRWAEEGLRDAECGAHAAALLPALVSLLVDQFQATGVVLIGSLARDDFRSDSDIDLVVAGIPAALLLKRERHSTAARLDRSISLPGSPRPTR